MTPSFLAAARRAELRVQSAKISSALRAAAKKDIVNYDSNPFRSAYDLSR